MAGSHFCEHWVKCLHYFLVLRSAIFQCKPEGLRSVNVPGLRQCDTLTLGLPVSAQKSTRLHMMWMLKASPPPLLLGCSIGPKLLLHSFWWHLGQTKKSKDSPNNHFPTVASVILGAFQALNYLVGLVSLFISCCKNVTIDSWALLVFGQVGFWVETCPVDCAQTLNYITNTRWQRWYLEHCGLNFVQWEEAMHHPSLRQWSVRTSYWTGSHVMCLIFAYPQLEAATTLILLVLGCHKKGS